ncbi:MAG TPA: hypothetical protein VLG09_01465 [Candidatus Saccharimonadales bacterium]|nr:hypothetical protein [Candidatus Saccharimonadales bacterium]
MDTEKQFAELGIKLGEAVLRNTAGAIASKIQATKAKKNNEETIQELEEIINTLVGDKNELVRIAQAYEQEFVAQQISKKDIEYITEKFIPVLKDLIKQTSGDDEKLQKTIDDLTPLLSVETLTVLQLLGFNYKKAIGEPLTLLLQRAIASKANPDSENAAEIQKLAIKYNTEFLKVTQDKEASDRFEQFKSKGLV